LPKRYFPNRNDSLIFDQIDYTFALNMSLIPLWNVLIRMNSLIALVASIIVIADILFTGLKIMMKVN
jgi:hypothetical protein